jgi:pimeloyl-ACP methyl ester carboxylesterase
MPKIFIIASLILCQFLVARDIQETTYSYWASPDIQIYYSAPPTISENTKIMFIIHGASRKAKQGLNDWLPLVEGRDVVLIAPEFSSEFYNEYAYLMKTTQTGRVLKDTSRDLESSLGDIFDFFSSKFKITTKKFRLYGHSGGSQFVHRYLLLSDETRVDKVAMANAGFYTFANPAIKYPFGIKNMDVSDHRLKWFLSLKGGVFLGGEDNNPKHRSLPSMRKAKQQGEHRLERGTNFFNHLVQLGVKKNMPFRWRYQVVPGVSHDNAGMSLAAANFLLEDL